MADLDFPDKNTMAEVISVLSSDDSIHELDCVFSDENFNTSQELQDLIISKKASRRIELLSIENLCWNWGGTRNRYNDLCHDFYLRCLKGPQNKIEGIYYSSVCPLSLADANRFSNAIVSNENITYLAFTTEFTGEGAFNCIFNAILDGGVQTLYLFLISNKIFERTGMSKLATNTTLKSLNLDIYQDDDQGAEDQEPLYVTDDEGMENLADVLKVNWVLTTIDIPRVVMTNVGRKYLLDSLRDNVTLSTLGTTKSLFTGEDPPEDEKEREKRIMLQSQIDQHMMLNRIWKRCNNNNNNNNNSNNSNRSGSYNNNNRTISLYIYPDLLEKLAKKPLLLFLFLQKHNYLLSQQRKNHQVFNCYYGH
jgi:hypothetical protein